MNILKFLQVFSFPCLALGAVFDLGELQWTLKNVNGSIAIPGTVPSQVHIDLQKAGIITEPLLGINGMHSLHVHPLKTIH